MKPIPYLPAIYGNATREEVAFALINLGKALHSGAIDAPYPHVTKRLLEYLPLPGLRLEGEMIYVGIPSWP